LNNCFKREHVTETHSESHGIFVGVADVWVLAVRTRFSHTEQD